MLRGEIITFACELHTDAQMPCLGRVYSCLILNVVVHKATTGSQRAKNQNAGIYHDPDKCVFHNIVILFQVSILKEMCQLKILCALACLFRVHRDIRNVVYKKKTAGDIHRSIGS
jgi:hypothetical protein